MEDLDFRFRESLVKHRQLPQGGRVIDAQLEIARSFRFFGRRGDLRREFRGPKQHAFGGIERGRFRKPSPALYAYVNLLFVVGRAARKNIFTANLQLERGKFPFFERIGRLHVVMTVREDYRFPRRIHPFGDCHTRRS